jgi:hypothetical protein
MDALRYLGAATPGTMPAAVPGAGPSSLGQPLSPLSGPAAPSQLPPPGAIPGNPSMLPPPIFAPGPADQKYEAVTQIDGSILLHLKNPDGSLGPAIQIVKAPKAPSGR